MMETKILNEDILANLPVFKMAKNQNCLLKDSLAIVGENIEELCPVKSCEDKLAATHPREAMTSLAAKQTITAHINVNTIYNVGTVVAGTTLLLELSTKASTKVAFQSSFDAATIFVTTVFYIENGSAVIVTQSQNQLGYFDIDSFLPLGGTYYIQIDVLSGGGAMLLVASELNKFSSREPNDNLYQALGLVPEAKIDVYDFFDNALDYDFYAITSPAAGKVAYVNFSSDPAALMNGHIFNNPTIDLMIFYKSPDSSITLESSLTLATPIYDYQIEFANAGHYIIAVAPSDSYNSVQIEEHYHFSIDFTRQITNLISKSHLVNIALYNGSIDYGRYDEADKAEKSIFWINGTAVRLMGSISNWAGGTGQFLVRVTNAYKDPVILTIVNVDENGNYNAVIPLNKCQQRLPQEIYHGEILEWNYMSFLGNENLNDSGMLDPAVTIEGMSVQNRNKIWNKYLTVGVCYDPVE